MNELASFSLFGDRVVRAPRRGHRGCGMLFLAVPFAVLLLFGCARGYDMDRPAPFRPYEDSQHLKMITAEGVLLKAREVENYPKASLKFWADAMQEHLTEQGYALKSTDCFRTQSGLPGCTLDFLLPHGAVDWVMSETLFVDDDTIYLLEAAGPYDRFTKVEAPLKQSYRTFRVK